MHVQHLPRPGGRQLVKLSSAPLGVSNFEITADMSDDM